MHPVGERLATDYTVDAATVAAARSGDQQALEQLIKDSLPLVYNIAGRALDGHLDVDDVVQETMLQVVDSLKQLRDPESFRSWMVAITIQKVRERWRHQQKPAAVGPLDEAYGTADPGADFVDLTILRLGLSGQRREVAEATRWLEPEERELLSLWWLEAAGELTRQELATALDLSLPHAAVRVQRMKARLDTARAVVRALRASPPCADLVMLTVAWDGTPTALWRKRLGRLLPLPAGLAMGSLLHGTATHAAAAHAGAIAGRSARLGHFLAAKPAATLTAAALVLGGAATTGYVLNQRTAPPATPAAPANRPPSPETASTSPSQAPTIPPSTTASSDSRAPRYGENVDQADSPPPATARPATLPTRPESSPVTISGKYAKQISASAYFLAHRGEYLTISGRGYLVLTWQIDYFTRGPGQIRMPTWTGLSGRIFHVASGGGHRMDDPVPGATPGQTWMGSPEKGFSTVPAGTRQMWQNEYYYLDGTVTLHLNEHGTDYNLLVGPTSRSGIVDDIAQPPSSDPAKGRVRYGEVRDTGADDAPVPQYLTRSSPTDPASVPERSRVET
ncbi:MAG: hypothetical protein AUG49_02995 [Catenulispora sp. 13_1_20CM_3_70_7]|nr:MAG: hypothetical protein AUG49_02995 [Catenulispora sp. 13_1_20CM_3_70_7]